MDLRKVFNGANMYCGITEGCVYPDTVTGPLSVSRDAMFIWDKVDGKYRWNRIIPNTVCQFLGYNTAFLYDPDTEVESAENDTDEQEVINDCLTAYTDCRLNSEDDGENPYVGPCDGCYSLKPHCTGHCHVTWDQVGQPDDGEDLPYSPEAMNDPDNSPGV